MTKATPHYLLCYNTSVIFHLLKGPLILDFYYIGLLYWTGCHNALNRPIKCLKTERSSLQTKHQEICAERQELHLILKA